MGQVGKPKGLPKSGGRKKGTPNKTTAVLKDAILMAAEQAGGDTGLVGYLKKQADDCPQSFLPLLGKVLPLQIGGDPDNPLKHTIEVHIVDHRPSDQG
jgi:hypothetical protein